MNILNATNLPPSIEIYTWLAIVGAILIPAVIITVIMVVARVVKANSSKSKEGSFAKRITAKLDGDFNKIHREFVSAIDRLKEGQL